MQWASMVDDVDLPTIVAIMDRCHPSLLAVVALRLCKKNGKSFRVYSRIIVTENLHLLLIFLQCFTFSRKSPNQS